MVEIFPHLMQEKTGVKTIDANFLVPNNLSFPDWFHGHLQSHIHE